MKVVRESGAKWIHGKGVLNYRKRIIMNSVPASVNLIEAVVIPPNGSVPLHKHKGTEEIFYITKGKIKMAIDGKEIELSAGDTLYIDKQTEHGFKNDSPDDLEMLVLKINFAQGDAILNE